MAFGIRIDRVFWIDSLLRIDSVFRIELGYNGEFIMGKGTITLAHGSGGKDSAELMDRIFGRYFSNDILDKMEDAAVLPVDSVDGNRIVISTDSFVVTPLEFKGGNIGSLSVCGTVNDVLMMGADVRYLTCGFVLEEGLEIEVLERIVASMAEEAHNAGVKIVAGDTKVVDSKGSAGMTINTTGIGFLHKSMDISASNCKSGDVVIVSGNLGDHHACILSERMNIENNISSDCAVLAELTKPLLDGDFGIHAMRDVTRGGLGTVLNELAEASGKSIMLLEKSIPVDSEVRGFCGIMGLDPMYMGNEGKMVLVVSEEDSQRVLDIMRSKPLGTNAQIIGRVEEGAGVFEKTTIGGTRKIDVLYGEGLPRIC